MKLQRSLALLALLSAWLALPLSDTNGGWGYGGCSAVGRVQAASPEWTWKYADTEFGYHGYLYRHGKLYGFWDYTNSRWLPVVAGTPMPFKRMPNPCGEGCPCDQCGDDCKCSAGNVCSESCECVAAEKARRAPIEQNFGINLSKMTPDTGKTVYRYKGAEIPRVQAHHAVEGSLPDDAGKLRLTAIGDKAAREQVAKDVTTSKAFEKLRDSLIVKDYAPDHWAVKDMGYVASGRPTIYLQAPDGKVLHRQDDYDGGPEALAAAVEKVEAIRKPDPKYNAKTDPDLRKSSGSSSDWWQLPALIVSGIALLWFMRRPLPV